MHSSTLLPLTLTLSLLAFTAALPIPVPNPVPLNINLGAYSPALVVGDGEIAFEGGEGEGSTATQIVDALQGAAVTGGAAASSAASSATDNSNNNSSSNSSEAVVVTAPGTVQAAATVDDNAEGVADNGKPRPILNDPTAALRTPGSDALLEPRP